MDSYLAPEQAGSGTDDPYGPGSALVALAGFCERAGLPLPPLPEAFIPLLTEVGEGVFSSRDDLGTLADMDTLIAEAVAGEGVPFVALSHEGYGTNAWYVRYCVSLPAASVFATVPFGGLYRDAAADRDVIEDMFAEAAALIGRALDWDGETSFVVDYRGLGRARWCEAGGAWQDDAEAVSTVASALAG